MVNRETGTNEIKNFIAICNKDGIRFNKVLFFGSALRNEADDNSDIDVMLFSDLFSDDFIANKIMMKKQIVKYSNLDIKAYNTRKYYEGDLFIDEVKKDCLEISI